MPSDKRIKIGIFDHTSGAGAPGGAQLVNAYMAEILSREYDVELIHGAQYDVATLADLFDVDLSRVKLRREDVIAQSFSIPGPGPFYKQILAYHMLSSRYDVFIYSGHSVPPFCHAKTGIMYCHFPIEVPFHRYEQGKDEKWMSRHALDRAIRSRIYKAFWKARMSKYKLILANSQFTSSWVEQRYGMKSTVIYPPVANNIVKLPKQNIVVSVGRFTGQARSKNQHLQIAAFKEMLARVPEPWSLHLVGSCSQSAEDIGYLRHLRTLADGLSVEFIVNAERAVLDRSLSKARIFWHTSGLSIDEAVEPALAEHFGIATVEAMGAGCVPIVIATGGQREIINDGVNGYLCSSIDQLVSAAEKLASDRQLLEKMSKSAEIRYNAFSRNTFREAFMNSIEQHLIL